MQQAYPVMFTKEGDSVIAEFPDVPEAMTVGANEDNVLERAQDALVVALSGYLDERRDIPKPSKPKVGQKAVILPPLIASKLAIYQAMRDQEPHNLTLPKDYIAMRGKFADCLILATIQGWI